MSRRSPSIRITSIVGAAAVSLVCALGGALADERGGYGDTVALNEALGRDGWQFGAWPSSRSDDGGDHDVLNAMRPKPRGAGWSIPLHLADEATLRTWGTEDRRLDGGRSVSSGVLMDVAIGAFTFTPSVGASFGASTGNGGSGTDPQARLRSQFEVGYRFGDTSQLVLGYGRVTGIGSDEGSLENHDVVSLTYRLPFGSLLGW